MSETVVVGSRPSLKRCICPVRRYLQLINQPLQIHLVGERTKTCRAVIKVLLGSYFFFSFFIYFTFLDASVTHLFINSREPAGGYS